MIRLLCAGLGGMGYADWSSAAKVRSFQIVAGADVSESARQRFEEQTRCPAFPDFLQALRAVPADAALIATPDAFHAPYSIAAMEAGLDVICEKPMAATLSDARHMHRTATRLGRMLMIHHQLRWLPTYRHARAMIARGAVGALRQVAFDMSVFSDVCLNGYRSKLPHLMLKDLGIHHLDLIRFLTGSECRSIFARSWASNEERLAIPTTTHAYAILEMAGPITVCYRATMRAIREQTGYCCRAELTGSRGVLTVTGDAISLQTFGGHRAGQPPQAVAPRPSDGTPWPDFARAIRTRRPTLTASADNVKSMELMYAAIGSAETGHIVRLRSAAAR